MNGKGGGAVWDSDGEADRARRRMMVVRSIQP